jgi:hypothetical protein
MLFFGALHKDELIKVSDNIGRITQSNSTYACALRDTVYDAFIDLNSKSNEVLDVNSLVLQRQFNCYCFLPHLAWVEVDHSDAQEKIVDHWYLRESLVLFGPQVDRILSDTTLVVAYNGRARLAAANLKCLLDYYKHFFSPYLAIVIVQQGPEPTLDREGLPQDCDYIFLRESDRFDPQYCFAAGVVHANANRNYFIFSDSDIYLETLDIRANLRMCERYDCVTGFSHIIDLTHDASERLRATRSTRGLEIRSDSSNGRPGNYRFMHRRAMYNQRQARRFQSPNFALRLRQE